MKKDLLRAVKKDETPSIPVEKATTPIVRGG